MVLVYPGLPAAHPGHEGNLRRGGVAGLDNLTFSVLAAAHDAPHILHVATGINQYLGGPRLYPSRDTSRFEGNGMYRDLDSGETWKQLPFSLGVPGGGDSRILKSIESSAVGDTVLVSTSPGTELPDRSTHLTNYPNPFVGVTTMKFTAPKSARVSECLRFVGGPRRIRCRFALRHGYTPPVLEWPLFVAGRVPCADGDWWPSGRSVENSTKVNK